MTQKTKFEKKDTSDTKATFSREEVMAFANLGSYAAMRRQRYLEKVASRDPNPRLLDGAELLNPHSVVAEVDMQPLSMRQNLGRFMGQNIDYEAGFDTDTDDDNDASFIADDRIDNIPTPHELRARNLERKLDNARLEHQRAADAAREAGATPPPKTKNDQAEPDQASKEAPKSPS